MLQPVNPIEWWSEFLRGELTSAEARNYLSLGAFEWLSIPGLSTHPVGKSYGRTTQYDRLHSTVTVKWSEFRVWLIANRPKHVEHAEAAAAAICLEKSL